MRTITSVENAFEILGLIQRYDCITAAEIADELERSKSTIHYYLSTLEKHRFIIRDTNGYRIGMRFLDFGSHALQEQSLYRALDQETIQQKVDQLSEQTDETALIAVEEHGKCFYLYRSQQGQTNHVELMHETSPIATAFGKSILAFEPEETVTNILERDDQDQLTGELRDELAAVRENKIAYEEKDDGTCSLASPVMNEANGRVLGSVGIITETDRIEIPEQQLKARQFTQDLPDLVKEAALILESQIYMKTQECS